MALLNCGINYKTAPLELRERLVFSQDNLVASLKNLTEQQGIHESFILSTCNRTELYCHSEHEDSTVLTDWLADWHQLPTSDLKPYLYIHKEKASVQHLLRVASGLDSMILGEPEILGQVKEAIALAEKTGTLGTQLKLLSQHVFSVSKHIRTCTNIGANSISLGYIAAHLAKKIFSETANTQALLIGAGKTIELVAQYLHQENIPLIIANRTLTKAQRLAKQFNAKAISLAQLPDALLTANIIVTATSSSTPILGKGAVERTLKQHHDQPLLILDLGMPRNVEPEVSELTNVRLYALDHLKTLLDENRAKRLDSAAIAELIIENQASHFIKARRALKANKTIQAYREKILLMRNQQLDKALHELASGKEPAVILQKFAHTLTNKMLHYPTVNLRRAAFEGEEDLLIALEKLFDLT